MNGPTHPPLQDSPSSSSVNVPEWYGIQSTTACTFGKLVKYKIHGLNLTLTFADENGKCLLEPLPFPLEDPFAYVEAAIPCDSNGENTNQSLAQGGSLIFGRLTPSRFLLNDSSAVVVIYCRPTATVMSVNATWDSSTSALLSVENIQPLSPEQQRMYDPNNFTTSSLGSHAWNGYVIDPDISSDVPAQLIDQVNVWLNLTISVYVGTQWLNKSTVLSDGSVTDTPDACKPTVWFLVSS